MADVLLSSSFFVPTAFAKAEISWLRLSEVILSARLNDFFLCLI